MWIKNQLPYVCLFTTIYIWVCLSEQLCPAPVWISSHMPRWHKKANLPASQTLLNLLRSMTARLGWLDYVRKHHRGLIVGKPRLRRITIYFAPPQFSFPEAVFVCVCQSTGRVDDGDEAWGWEKGAMCARGGRWMMLQTPEPDGTEPLSSLVTVIMQSKLPSMMYVHVVVCVSHACL